MGVRFGKAIAGIIVKFVELITKAFECGAKITSMLADGIMRGIAKSKRLYCKSFSSNQRPPPAFSG
ncbi:MAG: hypothetical protein L6V95_15710 [Candidatus Melainabacteria bacterium]|nr:MAG: hypothetical protein L6V95_15710 [Candidatus Melainabacteria bacterium]